MKTFYLTSILLFFVILIGCQKDDESSGFKVSGTLKSDGKPLGNASVDIDGLVQYKTSTNSEGYFILENIPAGNHSLNVKKRSTDNSFIQKSYDIAVQNSDLNFQSLILPNPILIDTILLDSLTNIATIKWNQSTAEDFREYKLYSHTTSEFDDTTGSLEHVTNDLHDTIKNIQLENLTKKYFMVYVLNEYGQLGGSNTKSISSINIQPDDIYYSQINSNNEFNSVRSYSLQSQCNPNPIPKDSIVEFYIDLDLDSINDYKIIVEHGRYYNVSTGHCAPPSSYLINIDGLDGAMVAMDTTKMISVLQMDSLQLISKSLSWKETGCIKRTGDAPGLLGEITEIRKDYIGLKFNNQYGWLKFEPRENNGIKLIEYAFNKTKGNFIITGQRD